MLSLRPALTPAEITKILKATARHFPTGTDSIDGDGSTSRFGAGLIDAYQAVSAVATAVPVISASPLFMDFWTHVGDANPASQALTIANAGQGTLNWTVSSTEEWLRVTPTSGRRRYCYRFRRHHRPVGQQCSQRGHHDLLRGQRIPR